MGRLLKASELTDFIGKQVNITKLTDDEGFDGLTYYWTKATYISATLLGYDATRQLVQFMSRSGKTVEVHPLEVRAPA